MTPEHPLLKQKRDEQPILTVPPHLHPGRVMPFDNPGGISQNRGNVFDRYAVHEEPHRHRISKHVRATFHARELEKRL
jgi:hypothetical protein